MINKLKRFLEDLAKDKKVDDKSIIQEIKEVETPSNEIKPIFNKNIK